MYVNVKKLNVRAGPSKDYEIIDQLNKGDAVYVLSEENGWAMIDTVLNDGYVYSKYLSEENVKSEEKGIKSIPAFTWIIFIAIIIFLKKLFFSGRTNTKYKNIKKSSTVIETQKHNSQKYYCKHCGEERNSIRILTSFNCSKSPTNKHQPYEGGIQDKYSCKHCGEERDSLRILTSFNCSKSPTKKHQPL